MARRPILAAARQILRCGFRGVLCARLGLGASTTCSVLQVRKGATSTSRRGALEMDSNEGRWATVGSSDANDVYLGNRLQYREVVETRITGTVTGQMLKPIFVRFLYSYLFLIVISVILSVILFVSSLSSGDAFSTDEGGVNGFVTGISSFIGLIWWLLPFLVFVFPQRIPINEWGLLLDGKAAAAESAYAHIFESLRRRRSPLTAEAKRIVTSMVPRTEGYYLVLKRDQFTGYVSVFGFGRDLYVGWSMWWELIPLVMIGLFIGQKVSGLFGANTLLHQVLRADPIKAFREVIHSSTREGVDAANAGREGSIAATFGYDVPFEQMDVASGPGDFLEVRGSGASRVPVPPRPATRPPSRPTTPPRPPSPSERRSASADRDAVSERPQSARSVRKAPPPSPDSRLD